MTTTVTDWRDHFIAIRSNKIFEMVVISIIIFSALLVGASTYNISPNWLGVMTVLDISVTIFFLIEISIRMAAERRFLNFFKSGWNIFDFLIVTASLIPIDESEMVLLARLLRIFRILRLISFIPELRILMNALATAIPRMGYVVLLMFIIFYIYAAVGSFLFESINSVLWGDLSISLLTLFRIATFEDWTDVMYETMEVYPFSWIYYLTFIFLTAFVFLNMMIGIVLDTMQSEHEKFNREEGIGEAGEVHWIKENSIQMNERMERMEAMLIQVTKQKKG
ncbi:MAG: ion transporter [Candidatus Polarisedimenticolaceae bacterium]|nr:ion transporter [Candidatus Polarisedimenticolaceae bacterium]